MDAAVFCRYHAADMRILGIETSCDESAAAYLEVVRGKVALVEQVVATQAIHAKYGGVVPEVAAREHAVLLPSALAELAEKVVGKPDGPALGRIVDCVAVTRGPGLVTSLRVGLDTVRALSVAWRKKIVGVNHIEGHVEANWFSEALRERLDEDRGLFPAVVLVVSGGHTELLLMKGHGRYRLLGATRDDAAGETFDKAAKLMGLGYPGGPALSRLARDGDARAFDFPRPMLNDPHHDFSFSGLKTAVRYFLERETARLSDRRFLADVAASVERTIVEVLVEKTVRAAGSTKAKTVLLAGGVAANGPLRLALASAVAERLPGAKFFEPPLEFCTDNAAMIALAGYVHAKRRDPRSGSGTSFDQVKKMEADPNWELGR